MEREELKKLIRENGAQQVELQREITAGLVALAEEKPDRWAREQAARSQLELRQRELASLLEGEGDRALLGVEELALAIEDRKSVIAHRDRVDAHLERQAVATERWATALERIATALEKAAEAT